MKKIIAIVFLFASFCSYSQSIELFYKKKYVNPNDTLTITVPSISFTEHYLDIVNASANDVDLVIERNRISLLQGSENTFCFETCFSPEYDGPTAPFHFSAGDTLKEDFFHTTYDPNGKEGISLIQYTFYDKDDLSGTMSTSVMFKFVSEGVGIQENIAESVGLHVYPNPTTGQITVKSGQVYKVESVEIYDVVGQVVGAYRIQPENTDTVIDISHLSAGIYFLKIETANGTITKKVVKE